MVNDQEFVFMRTQPVIVAFFASLGVFSAKMLRLVVCLALNVSPKASHRISGNSAQMGRSALKSSE